MKEKFPIALCLLAASLLAARAQRDAGEYSLPEESLHSAGGISTGNGYAHSAALGENFVGVSSAPGYLASYGYRLQLPKRSAQELILNGSFEDPFGSFVADSYRLMALFPASTAIPGWKTTHAELAWVRNDNTFGAESPYGEFSLDLTGYHDRPPYGGVEQVIATVPGEEYSLSISMGSNSSYPGAGGQKQVMVTAGLGSAIFTFDPAGKEEHEWHTFSFVFSADSGATTIGISGLRAGGGVFLGLDNVSVVLALDRASLNVEAIRTSNSELRIQFPAISGRKYALESRADFGSGTWLAVPATVIDNGDGTRQLTLPDVLSNARQFYRVKEEP
ncbi:MAG: DUF642 domain-containing protein [Verrucomicrobiia bacterium]